MEAAHNDLREKWNRAWHSLAHAPPRRSLRAFLARAQIGHPFAAIWVAVAVFFHAPAQGKMPDTLVQRPSAASPHADRPDPGTTDERKMDCKAGWFRAVPCGRPPAPSGRRASEPFDKGDRALALPPLRRDHSGRACVPRARKH